MAPSLAVIHSEIGMLIARLARVWRREANEALADRGLSEATALPLMVLSRRGRRGKGVRQGVLADELGIEGPSLVRLLDVLEGEGMVARREDPTDRRAKLLHISPKGEAKAGEAEQVLRRVRAYLLKDIAAGELATTFDVLQRIERRAARMHEAASALEA